MVAIDTKLTTMEEKNSRAASKKGRWLVPGEVDWEVHDPDTSLGRSTLDTIDAAPPANISFVAFPPQMVTCQLFWLETIDEKAVPDLLRMQCERRALLRQDEVWQYRVLRKESARSLAQVLILQNALPSGLLVDGDSQFGALPFCLDLPSHSVCLSRSLGTIYLVITDSEGVLYFQTLPHQSLTPPCLRDVQALLWMAEAQSWVECRKSLILLGDWPEEELEAPFLEKAGLKLVKLPMPRLILPDPSLELIPTPVRQLRKVRQRQSQIRRAALFVGILYAAFILFEIVVATSIRVSNQRMEAKFNSLLPEMMAHQETARRLDALNPAFDTQTYPIEILHRVMTLLPETGVRLTRFEIVGDRVELGGESSTAREAFDFQNAIQSSPSLKHISWEDPPQPVPLPNDTTRFSIQGTITGAYHDAEES